MLLSHLLRLKSWDSLISRVQQQLMAQMYETLCFSLGLPWPWPMTFFKACSVTLTNHMLEIYTTFWLGGISRVTAKVNTSHFLIGAGSAVNCLISWNSCNVESELEAHLLPSQDNQGATLQKTPCKCWYDWPFFLLALFCSQFKAWPTGTTQETSWEWAGICAVTPGIQSCEQYVYCTGLFALCRLALTQAGVSMNLHCGH